MPKCEKETNGDKLNAADAGEDDFEYNCYQKMLVS